jgi:hypothetical protein
MPRLAVVVVSWNVRELLASCLRSLFDDLNRAGVRASTWVVDNASSDSTPELVEDVFPAVHLRTLHENRGFAAGNNVALQEILGQDRQARAELVWLLNPDTEVQPGATRALVETMAARPGVGVVGARLTFPDGSLQQSGFRFPGLIQLLFELFPMPERMYDTRLNGRYPRRLYEGNRPFPIDHPLGASMMVRRAAIDDVGLLDEGYHMYCEEIDWCWRMHKAGWDALCVPRAEVIHYAGQSTSQIPVHSFTNLWVSRARLYARHNGPVTWRLSRILVRLGMRRKMADARPEMIQACRYVIKAWETVR